MNAIEHLIENASSIESRLGYIFKDKALLALAFTHRSYINENKNVTQHNERLEFLGDSVLGLLMAEHLYNHLPDTPEGDLSFLRSRLVEAEACVSYMQKLRVAQYILLGKGEKRNDGRGRDSIHADLFEAIIGAIFLDGGLVAAHQFLFTNFLTDIEAILKTPLRNWKALLQDLCQRQFQQPPHYKVISEAGPDHSKIFQIAVMIGDQELGRGEGSSKKEAQQAAAADALTRFKQE